MEPIARPWRFRFDFSSRLWLLYFDLSRFLFDDLLSYRNVTYLKGYLALFLSFLVFHIIVRLLLYLCQQARSVERVALVRI